jgi:alpha-ribazole phosphatase/probable phosphoglycerate mutase
MPKFVKSPFPRDRITRVYLIRHGAVGEEWDERVYGQLDVALSARGEEQADALAGRLSQKPLHAVYASDLVRALETARRIAQPHELHVEVVPALREASFGHWQGQDWSDILERHAEEVEARFADLARARMRDGESFEDLRERVLPAFGSLVEKHRGECVAVVSHGGVTRVIVADALGLDLSHSIRLEQRHCCLNIIDYAPDGPLVRLLNG